MADASTLDKIDKANFIEDLRHCKVGDVFPSTFGVAPAQLFCVERIVIPNLSLRFRVMCYGVEVAEVAATIKADGKWTFEVMS